MSQIIAGPIVLSFVAISHRCSSFVASTQCCCCSIVTSQKSVGFKSQIEFDGGQELGFRVGVLSLCGVGLETNCVGDGLKPHDGLRIT